ncbi:MAG TPA: GTP diphosphokinase [Gammaproteobacteria bacterium]|nr:GTP pyrophosphokinase [bacterium BMS3Abin12]HDK02726.1 GTP diphosphokinase [Gammaproteobacteria bacterium]
MLNRKMSDAIDTPVASPALPEAWLGSVTEGMTPEQGGLIRRALACALPAHEGQRRASGEPYVRHSMAVAEILAGLHLDAETIAAAILHDVIEDTPLTLEELAREFGPTVARLVDGVTKMDVIHDVRGLREKGRRERDQAESLRKMLLAMAEDVRVVLVKLADRLHNMRTLQHLPLDRRRRIARETLEIYAPLANRLGIWQLKWELEDLALRHLEPDTYREIARLLDESRSDRERYIARQVERIRTALAGAGVRAEVSGRPKHIYSIRRKMQRKRVEFHQIFDVRAIRILVREVVDCYAALGVVHGLWHHIPREFDDYIANPKENQYRSLHTAVVGSEGKVLEVQIRTFEMHRQAELGVAAHWSYKEGVDSDEAMARRIAWLRQLFEWKEENPEAGDFIDRFKSEIFEDRVYVLTPQGRVISLPIGATPLDFAYHIHTDVGHRCRGAKVNGRIVPLTYELRSGEQVQVLTTRQGGPSRDWLNPHLGHLKTSRARAKVRHWFKQQDRGKNIAAGRALVDRELHRVGLSGVSLERIARHFHYPGAEDFLSAVGAGDLNASQIAAAAHALLAPAPVPPPAAPAGRPGPKAVPRGEVVIGGVGDLLTHMARCCRPVPGDDIIGFITRGRGVSVHRRDCPNILRMPEENRERLIEVSWGSSGDARYSVEVAVDAYDRPGLLRDITTILAGEGINVVAADTLTDRAERRARMDLTLEITGIGQLSRALNRIGRLRNVLEVHRRV